MPSIRPVHSPTQEPECLWVQGGEWERCPGLSCSRDPRPSSCESLGRAGKGAFSCPALTSTAQPAHSCWGQVGLGTVGVQAGWGTVVWEQPARVIPRQRGFSGVRQKLLLFLFGSHCCSAMCAESHVRPGRSPGALSREGDIPGQGGSQGWALCVPAALPWSPGTHPCPSRAGTSCNRYPVLAPGLAPQLTAKGTAAQEHWVGDGRAHPVPGHTVQGVAGLAAGEEGAHSGLAWSSGWGGGTRQRVLGRANPAVPRNWGRPACCLCPVWEWRGGAASRCGIALPPTPAALGHSTRFPGQPQSPAVGGRGWSTLMRAPGLRTGLTLPRP